ncbi:MAG: glycosyltransferase, partial [Boseongicola sp. SB0662_bin_57]|nr:glycosyltransferase [Boseongicola sp. SB0662_bin_57]
MNVLFVASECAPFVKTGGLADVIGAVPKALAAAGTETRVLIPAYPALHGLASGGQTVKVLDDLFGGKAEVKAVNAEGLDVLLLVAPHLYGREGNIYLGPDGKDWSDNHLRFAALGCAGAELALDGAEGWMPDVVHVHDWQAGLLPAYLSQSGRNAPPVVMTIHNIAFQGLFDASHMANLKLKREMFTPDGVEFHGRIGFLKAGLALSDRITTVSPSYACELLTPEFGMGLDGLLRARRNDLSGILNGIDLETWSPESDPHLVERYSARSLRRREA